VVDIQETPAVPPTDYAGDGRLGYFIAGGLLIAVGWAFAVGLNLLLHAWAGGGGVSLFGHRITSTLGPYAWATLGFGIFTGAMGVVLLALGRASPKGRFVLPGYDY
jgi:hypothetical protein